MEFVKSIDTNHDTTNGIYRVSLTNKPNEDQYYRWPIKYDMRFLFRYEGGGNNWYKRNSYNQFFDVYCDPTSTILTLPDTKWVYTYEILYNEPDVP